MHLENSISGQSTNLSRAGNITKTTVPAPTTIKNAPLESTSHRPDTAPSCPEKPREKNGNPTTAPWHTRRLSLDDSFEENPFAKRQYIPEKSAPLSPEQDISPLPPSPDHLPPSQEELPPAPFSPDGGSLDDTVIDDALLASLRGTPEGPDSPPSPPNKRVSLITPDKTAGISGNFRPEALILCLVLFTATQMILAVCHIPQIQ